jgi:hypothetical protein
LAAGLLVGCWTAWYWVSREQRSIGAAAREGDPPPVTPRPRSQDEEDDRG